MGEEEFYRQCAAILGAEDVYRPRMASRRSRWNNRDAGNGRFPGFGTIRMFGPSKIHIALRRPVPIARVCASAEEALALLRRLCALPGSTVGGGRG